MPFGTGAELANNSPGTPFTANPAMFDQLTARLHHTPITKADPGATGGQWIEELPKSGIITWATVTFRGTLTCVPGSGANTTSWRWPYGLIRNLAFSANTNNGLINVSGTDLHVHRFLTNPSYIEGTDVHPGTVGGGNTLGTLTNDPVFLTWQVPIVMDRMSLVGAIYAQSNANALTLAVDRAPTAELVTSTGTATCTITGTWTVHVDSFRIPRDAERGIITPDLSRLHSLNGFDTPLTSTGEPKYYLIPEPGQLMRLLVQVRPNATSFTDPRIGATADWTRLRFEYGGNERPIDIDAGVLVSRNNEHYGARLPYGYVCLDFVRENPVRDSVIFSGITEPRVVPVLDSGLAISSGQVRLVQETLRG